MDSCDEISLYKKFRVWLNKKTSVFLAKRAKNEDYLSIEKGMLKIFLDGVLFNIVLTSFIPFSILHILQLGCLVFVFEKYVFPKIIQIFNSINLVKVGS